MVGYTHETMDMGPAGHYYVLSVGGVGRGGVTVQLRSDVGHGAPHWLPYVAADDPDTTLARVAPLGGKVPVPAMDVPGVGRFGVLQDPTGAALAVMKALPPKGE